MAYTTQKLSRNRVAIFRDDEYLCQLRPEEVKGWIARAERSDAIDAEFEVARRQHRIKAVRSYLAKRAARPPQPKQLDLF